MLPCKKLPAKTCLLHFQLWNKSELYTFYRPKNKQTNKNYVTRSPEVCCFNEYIASTYSVQRYLSLKNIWISYQASFVENYLSSMKRAAATTVTRIATQSLFIFRDLLYVCKEFLKSMKGILLQRSQIWLFGRDIYIMRVFNYKTSMTWRHLFSKVADHYLLCNHLDTMDRNNTHCAETYDIFNWCLAGEARKWGITVNGKYFRRHLLINLSPITSCIWITLE